MPVGLWLSGDLYLRLFIFFPVVQLVANVEITRYLGHQTLSLLLAEQKLTDANSRLSATCTDLTSANVQLARLSDTDGLTGIANRRAFDAALAAEWARATRDGTALGLLLIDVDFFKAFNDRTGHLAGDACLCRIAAALAGAVSRPADLVARFGGEEFVVLLPGTGIEGACDVAMRMRAALRALAIGHPASPLGWVTASFGAAEMMTVAAASADDLIDAADRALYRAKQSGRDRVCLATEATVKRGVA
jgi:diguanylate cyclase (GGDEF)-like protein